MENLKEYIKAEKKNPKAQVTINNIIIPGLNDNEKEYKEFVKRCNKIGCSNIEVNVEFYWMNENFDKPISDILKNTLLFFKSQPNVVFSSNISTHITNWLERNL